MIKWQWKKFDKLSTDDLYEIMKARQDVFVVEQNCVYQDIDNLDDKAWHLIGWDINDSGLQNICAYSRIVYPGYKYKEPSIGRVLTVKQFRRTGLGKELMTNALGNIEKEYPYQPVRISAQLYLNKFYSAFGFKNVSEPYDEDNIPHVEMLRL
ncbi:MAG: GNAT family N-acetyltransferase [bacterium]|nr:GNAT family N-acetyltransferase [bacterium]